MDIVKVLRIERDKTARRLAGIDGAIAALNGERGVVVETSRPKRYVHSAASRRRIGLAVKKRWLEKRRAEKNGKK